MATTETSDVTGGWDGDVPETAITNEMASEPGFPARKADGELVNIVKQYAEGTRKVLVDEDGNKYVDDGVYGVLVAYEEADEEAGEQPTAAEVLQESVEANQESAVEGNWVQETEVSATDEQGTPDEQPDAA